MNKLYGIFILIFPLFSFAAQTTIICDEPMGSRVDYFAFNSMNLENEKFIMGKDKVSGMKPIITLNSNNHDVGFVISDAADAKSVQPKKGEMKVLAYNDDQISFVGLVNGAPILATYYPKIQILIYSQQSIWPGPNYQGARAVIFYAKCSKSSESVKFSV